MVINLTFFFVEVIGGTITHSLSLLADAGHMFGDVAALVIALVVMHLARQTPTEKRTFGLLRAEVLGAFINGAGLLVITVFIFKEAWDRISSEPAIDGPLMLVIAVLGLFANVASTAILWRNRAEDINIHGAFLHMMADSLGSVAVIIASGVIWAFGWYPMDIIASVCVGGIIVWSTWHFMKRTMAILLESTPENVNFDAVKSALTDMPHVVRVHDLHIWTITSGMPVLTVHLTLSDQCHATGHWPVCLDEAKKRINERFGIWHSTLEIEICGAAHPEKGCEFMSGEASV